MTHGSARMRGGITRTFRGLRSGDQRTLYTGVAMVVYSIWRRRRGSRRLVYRRVLKNNEALLIRTGRRDTKKIVVPDDLADQVALQPESSPSKKRTR